MAKYFQTFDDGTHFAAYPGFTVKISRSGDDAFAYDDSSTGRKALMISKMGTQGSLAVAWDVLNGEQDVEQLILFKMNGATPTTGRYGILLNRYDGNSEATTRGFSATFTPVSNTPSIIINEDSVGTIHFTNYAWQNDQMYWARFRVNGNDQSFKIWPYGEDEPTAWTLSGTFAGSTIANPYSGLGNFQAWSQMLVYQISAGTNGDTAPKTDPSIPSSTPLGVMGGGFASLAYGTAFRPAFTTEHLDQIGNARVQRVGGSTINGNARIQRTENTTQQGNARIRRTLTTTRVGNARIRRTEATSQNGAAVIERIESTSQNGNATIESYFFPASVDQQGNARIQKAISSTQLGNARIERTANTEQLGAAHIERVEGTSQTGNATLYRIDQLDQVGNATLEKDKFKDQIGNATIIRIDSLPQQGDARIERTVTTTQLGRAVIIRVDGLDQPGNARIERISTITIVGNAKISNPSPDKRPQQWQDSSTEQPAEWQSEDRAEQVWDQTADKAETQWQDSDQTQEQQWSDTDNKQPTEWRRQFYD